MRNEHPPLAVRLTFGGLGKQGTHGPGLGHGQGGELLGKDLPALLRVDGKALVQPQSEVAHRAQLLPELGGNEQTALGVEAVLIGTGHAPHAVHSLHFPAKKLIFTPFCSTRVPSIKRCAKNCNSFFRFFNKKNTGFPTKTGAFPHQNVCSITKSDKVWCLFSFPHTFPCGFSLISAPAAHQHWGGGIPWDRVFFNCGGLLMAADGTIRYFLGANSPQGF